MDDQPSKSSCDECILKLKQTMAFTIWRRARLNSLAIIILLLGLGTGDLIYWRAGTDDAPTDDEVLADQEQSKAYQREIERNVGAFGALMARWSDSLAELGQPKPLALTIMIVSCAVAGGCFWVASRQPE